VFFSLQFDDSLNGSAPYKWSATGLQSGLSINSTGLTSGMPTQTGVFSVVVNVVSSSLACQFPLNLTITGSGSSGPEIISVTPIGPTCAQTITINGKGFGANAQYDGDCR